ncbi:Uncharacterised protein, partial [Mycoplasmoides gallisepticum]
MNAPIIENAANQRKDQYDWYEIDVDKEQIW